MYPQYLHLQYILHLSYPTLLLVLVKGLEPIRLSTLDPKSSASANFAILANIKTVATGNAPVEIKARFLSTIEVRKPK